MNPLEVGDIKEIRTRKIPFIALIFSITFNFSLKYGKYFINLVNKKLCGENGNQ